MELTKVSVSIISLVALTLTLSLVVQMPSMDSQMENTAAAETAASELADQSALQPPVLSTSKRVSRFLAQNNNPRAADHCKKDNSICYLQGTNATTCCNNKCTDTQNDNNNCGSCKNKCKFTETCCRGECVYLAFDKRHCGECNSPCDDGRYCVYGMCSNYAG